MTFSDVVTREQNRGCDDQTDVMVKVQTIEHVAAGTTTSSATKEFVLLPSFLQSFFLLVAF